MTLNVPVRERKRIIIMIMENSIFKKIKKKKKMENS